MGSQTRHGTRPLAVAIGSLLIGLGYLAIFSIGLPIIVAGLLTLIAGLTGAHREQPAVFWPVAAGLATFFAVYVLVAPLTCTSTGSARIGTATDATNSVADAEGTTPGMTECTNVLGIDYSGGADYDPPQWPAVLTGVAAAVSVGWGTRRLVLGRREVTP